jgi:hypothetical protein
LPFLRRIACDNNDEPRKVEFWVKKFFESLQQAIEGKLNFQEAAYSDTRMEEFIVWWW